MFGKEEEDEARNLIACGCGVKHRLSSCQRNAHRPYTGIHVLLVAVSVCTKPFCGLPNAVLINENCNLDNGKRFLHKIMGSAIYFICRCLRRFGKVSSTNNRRCIFKLSACFRFKWINNGRKYKIKLWLHP